MKKKPSSKHAAYILERRKLKDPEDNDYRQAKRIGTSQGTLHNLYYKYKNPFQKNILFMRICADLGLNPESVIALEDIPYDRDVELNYWKERCFAAERKIKEKEKKEKDAVKMLSDHLGTHNEKPNH